MRAIDFVKSHYPDAIVYAMIDNKRRQTSYVILKAPFEIFTNEGATTASKAWTNAKKEILKMIEETKNLKN